MGTLVGIVLLGIFLFFAVLMFLEKLSALLALPLMAISFLVVTVAADFCQPAVVTETQTVESRNDIGRTVRVTEPEAMPSRFATWQQARFEQLELLHKKAAYYVVAVDSLSKIPEDADSENYRQALVDIYGGVQELEQAVAAMQARFNSKRFNFFRNGHYAGQLQSFNDEWNSIAIMETLRPIASVGSSDEIQSILTYAKNRSDRALADYPQPAGRPMASVARVSDGGGDSDAEWAVKSSLRYPLSSTYAFTCWWESMLYYIMLVLGGGSLYLYKAIIATVFGGMFAVYVRNLKVAERMVYWTAEFAGETPFMISLAVFLVSAIVFTSVGGLGTVIMLGTIILPILRSIGLGPIHSAGVFLIGFCMGGTLNPVSRRLWMDVYGISASRLDLILWTMVGIYFLVGLIWIYLSTRKKSMSQFKAEEIEVPGPDESVPARLMVAPLIPVVLVYFARIEEITAFTVSLVYMLLCVIRRPGAVRVFTRSLIEGAQMVMPPVLLMVGIGILLTSLFTPPVQGYLRPLLMQVIPDTRLEYILLFVLAAPLALYRGPLNVWGMGLAVSGTLLAISSLPPAAILGAILAAGMLQGVCDPTNTYNVWIAGFQRVTVNQILRATIIPIWIAAASAIVLFGVWFVGA